MDNPHQKEDIKPYSMLVNREKSPSQYQDGDNMSYSEKEALKHLPETSNWPNFSGTGEYDHNLKDILVFGTKKWVKAIAGETGHGGRVKSFKSTAMVLGHGKRPFNLKMTRIYSPYKSSGFKEKQPSRVEFKDKPRERVAEVTKKKNSCHNIGSTDHYANNSPKAKKKVYAIEKVPEEEFPTEDSQSDSMGDAIREQSDEEQDPREEFLVEYQEESPLEI
ncbi:hypothetical protein O181_023095 [Austropuccinia psidii MF-1]|uniref:Uncharacterized protein n=1 Tax=Austropuccinia psidii MF-1 TaxID=1389203 RepID=A0A9Q3CHV4_9BASI|nr:hypothetical protein [Austropuccinia psidii MF-1]